MKRLVKVVRKLEKHWLLEQSRIQRDRLPVVPVSWGDLIDKITILEIKTERMRDKDKLTNVRLELAALTEVFNSELHNVDRTFVDLHKGSLKSINTALWDTENNIRQCERNKDFGADFIRLSRSVYIENDRRSRVKRNINLQLGSPLIEEKSHV